MAAKRRKQGKTKTPDDGRRIELGQVSARRKLFYYRRGIRQNSAEFIPVRLGKGEGGREKSNREKRILQNFYFLKKTCDLFTELCKSNRISIEAKLVFSLTIAAFEKQVRNRSLHRKKLKATLPTLTCSSCSIRLASGSLQRLFASAPQIAWWLRFGSKTKKRGRRK